MNRTRGADDVNMADGKISAKVSFVSSGKQTDDKSSPVHMATKEELPTPRVMEVHEVLSDAGQFGLAALCCHLLRELFEDEWHSQFKREITDKVLEELKQPHQVCDSIRAILAGQGLDDPDPYVDTLMDEEFIKKETAAPLVCALLHIALAKGKYDARLRTLLKHVSMRLRVNWDLLEEMEGQSAASITSQTYKVSEEEEKERKARAKKSKLRRVALIGLATIGGGTLIGLTGGLAAPLVAAGAGAIIGTAGAAVLGSTAGVAIIGSLFGVAGAGLTGLKMHRRVGQVEEFTFVPLLTGRHLQVESAATKQLHITIAVTGWLTNKMKDFRQPWQTLTESREQYCLCWESKYLLLLGNAIDYFLSFATSAATTEALKFTLLSGVVSASATPIGLLTAIQAMDNPFQVAAMRAAQSGIALAEVLLARKQGNRPVTLIGYSLGARVIFSCLEEMAKRKNSEGIVEDVILLGAPVPGGPKHWSPLGRVVSGRIVNGYCRSDWLLKFLYRTSSVQISIAGLAPVGWTDRRMHNIDLSDVVSGHADYMRQLDTIMKAVGVRTRDEFYTHLNSPSSASSSPSKEKEEGASSSSSKDLLQSDTAYEADLSSNEGWGVIKHKDVKEDHGDDDDKRSSCSFTSSESQHGEGEESDLAEDLEDGRTGQVTTVEDENRNKTEMEGSDSNQGSEAAVLDLSKLQMGDCKFKDEPKPPASQ